MGPGFSGWNEKSGLKQYTGGGGGETGDQTSFCTWIGPQGSFTSSFGFALPALSLLPIFLIKWSVIRIRSYKSSETDTHFHEMVPSFSHFTATIILGMKGGLKGQTRAQRQGDFTRMCSSTDINREASLVLGSHSYFQKANSKVMIELQGAFDCSWRSIVCKWRWKHCRIPRAIHTSCKTAIWSLCGSIPRSKSQINHYLSLDMVLWLRIFCTYSGG